MPFFLSLLGICWFLMALGSFTRDVAHLMISIVPVFMFATPIFYSIDDVPPHLRIYLHLNPIGNYVEMIRDLLLFNRLPGASFMPGRSLASLIIFFFGIGSSCNTRPCSSMSSELVISCDRVGKAFQLYMRRNDQLKQAIFGHWKQFYHQHWVLRDISFKVRRGETVGIIGRNGAGKTTLLQIICGITLPTLGRVQVIGRVAPILALGAGFDHELTGRENALIGGAILGMRRAAVEARLTDDRRLRRYRRLLLSTAQALFERHGGAACLCRLRACRRGYFDRGRSALGRRRGFRRKCDAFIKDFANHGTILVVSHDLETLRAICDRVIWIDDGVVRSMGAAKDVIARYREAIEGRPVAGARRKLLTAVA